MARLRQHPNILKMHAMAFAGTQGRWLLVSLQLYKANLLNSFNLNLNMHCYAGKETDAFMLLGKPTTHWLYLCLSCTHATALACSACAVLSMAPIDWGLSQQVLVWNILLNCVLCCAVLHYRRLLPDNFVGPHAAHSLPA